MTQSKRGALAEEHYQRTYGPDNTSEDKEFTLHDYQAGFNAAIEEVLALLDNEKIPNAPFYGPSEHRDYLKAKIKSLKEKL